jgi:hypothetical protein
MEILLRMQAQRLLICRAFLQLSTCIQQARLQLISNRIRRAPQGLHQLLRLRETRLQWLRAPRQQKLLFLLIPLQVIPAVLILM